MIPAELQIREQQLEHAIHRRCPISPPVPKKKRPPNKTLPIGDPVGLSFGTAARNCPELRVELIAAARRLNVLPISDALLRDFLLAASKKGATPAHVRCGERLLTSTSFRAHAPELQRDLLALYARLATAPELRAVFVETVELGVLSAKVLLPFLRYVAGPEPSLYAEPAHARTLERAWSTRVPELRLALISFGATTADAVATTHLAAQVRRVHVIKTREDKNAIVAFGDPTQPNTLTYAERHGALQSPAPYFNPPLEVRTARLTRLEELELIRWIELNHLITRRRSYRPPAMPFAKSSGELGLDRAVEAVCDLLTARRGRAAFETHLIPARAPRAA